MFGLTKKELAILGKLSTPIKIQDFLNATPRNCEKKGPTYMSPRRVLREKKMHCVEGALLAAAALWLHGEKPLVLDLRATYYDYDHLIALYKRNGHWGAISKTNHPVLRFRDPVYKTIRELVLSYFHEYTDEDSAESVKTLRSYSRPFDLSKLGTGWVTAEADLYAITKKIDALPHYPIIPKGNINLLRRPDKLERRFAKIMEWKKSDPRT
jgi:hypothetical protein